MKRLPSIALGLAAIALPIFAYGIRAQASAPKFVKAVPGTPKSVHAGKLFTLTVDVTIDNPYHIQGNPSKEGYIATELEVGPLRGFKVDKIVYPKPIQTSMSGEKLPVYEGKVVIRADITPDKNIKPGKYTVPISVKYQGCDEQKCFPPTNLVAKAVITVASGTR